MRRIPFMGIRRILIWRKINNKTKTACSLGTSGRIERGDFLFLFAVAVTAHELVYAACGIHEFLFAGEERM